MFSNRCELRNYVQQLFNQEKFAISGQCNLKSSCFDFMARKDVLWLIKVLINIDSLQHYHADELKLLSDLFSGVPLLVGEKNHRDQLEEDVLYRRYGIPAVNPPTLEKILFHEFPHVKADRGGLYAKVFGESLRERREEENLSRARLAKMVGVSERTIYEYERGTMDATQETLSRLEEVLNTKLRMPINLLDLTEFGEIEKHVPTKIGDFEWIQENLVEIGFEVHWTECAPFDAVTMEIERENEESSETIVTIETTPQIIVAGVGHKTEKNVRRRVQITRNIAQITEKIAMFVLEGSSTKNIEGVPIIHNKELSRFETSIEFIKELRKRRGISN